MKVLSIFILLCTLGCSQVNDFHSMDIPAKQDNALVTLEGMVYVDMLSSAYRTQHPLICIKEGDYPSGVEMIFTKQSNPEKWVHAVFSKKLLVPEKLNNKIILHGCFQRIQNKNCYKYKKPNADYRYFVVSSWEYQK